MPDKHTFAIWRDATFFEVLTLYETMDKTQPRDLTNYKAEMIIKKKPNDNSSNNIYLTLATANNPNPSSNGCSILLPTDLPSRGQIRLTITSDITAAINWNAAVYDLTITAPDGVKDALLYGGIKVNGV